MSRSRKVVDGAAVGASFVAVSPPVVRAVPSGGRISSAKRFKGSSEVTSPCFGAPRGRVADIFDDGSDDDSANVILAQ